MLETVTIVRGKRSMIRNDYQPNLFSACQGHRGEPAVGDVFTRGPVAIHFQRAEELSDREWAKLRAKFHCSVGVTNVWREPQVSGAERI